LREPTGHSWLNAVQRCCPAKLPEFAGIQASRIKTIRQLAAKPQPSGHSRQQATAQHCIDKYADYGSAVYAPPHSVKGASLMLSSQPPCPQQQQQQQEAQDLLTRRLSCWTLRQLAPSTLIGLQELRGQLASQGTAAAHAQAQATSQVELQPKGRGRCAQGCGDHQQHAEDC